MSKSLGNTVAPQDVIKQYGADILRLWVASSDYSDDLRIGKEIINTTVDSYRKLRNTMRWLLGNLAHYKRRRGRRLRRDARARAADPPPAAASSMRVVREAYDEYDYKRIVAALSNFMNVDLSAFYFDIRKDALYCDPISSVRRKASLTVLDHVFDCLTAWLAPILVFTMEEAGWSGIPARDSSVHLRLFPNVPAEWRDDALAEKWEKIRDVRRVVTGALEIARKDKVIGSSLEAAPKVYIADPDLLRRARGVDLAEIAITSAIDVTRWRGAGRCLPARRGPGRRRGVRARRGHALRPLVEDPAGRRLRSGVSRTSRRATPRRCASARRRGSAA